jgi:hypothetical protein
VNEDVEPDYDYNQPDQASDLDEDYFYVEGAS